MSIQIKALPQPLSKIIDSTSNIYELGDEYYSDDVNFKIRTNIPSVVDLEDILKNPNNLFGFKTKESLLNFSRQGEMLFYIVDSHVEILFMGNFPKNQAINFVTSICEEYDQNSGNSIFNVNLKEITDENHPKFRIQTDMKNIDIIESIMKENFLGFHSQEELNEFKERGKISLNKLEDNTYELVFFGNYQKDEVSNYVKNLNDAYKSKIQEMTYVKLIEKIKKNNYKLEKEIIDNENSIILTLNMD